MQYHIFQHIKDDTYISYLVESVNITPIRCKDLQKKDIEIIGIHLIFTKDFELIIKLSDDISFDIDDIPVSNELLFNYYIDHPFETWHKFTKYAIKALKVKNKDIK